MSSAKAGRARLSTTSSTTRSRCIHYPLSGRHALPPPGLPFLGTLPKSRLCASTPIAPGPREPAVQTRVSDSTGGFVPARPQVSLGISGDLGLLRHRIMCDRGHGVGPKPDLAGPDRQPEALLLIPRTSRADLGRDLAEVQPEDHGGRQLFDRGLAGLSPATPADVLEQG